MVLVKRSLEVMIIVAVCVMMTVTTANGYINDRRNRNEKSNNSVYDTTEPMLPADPLQRCAVKALRGDYGKLAAWQEKAYRSALEQEITTNKTFVLTAYLGTHPDGKVDRRGHWCTLRTAASNLIPYGSYIWTNQGGLRQILDCGARSNDRRARRIAGPHAIWVDYWFPNGKAARAKGAWNWDVREGAVWRCD